MCHATTLGTSACTAQRSAAVHHNEPRKIQICFCCQHSDEGSATYKLKSYFVHFKLQSFPIYPSSWSSLWYSDNMSELTWGPHSVLAGNDKVQELIITRLVDACIILRTDCKLTTSSRDVIVGMDEGQGATSRRHVACAIRC